MKNNKKPSIPHSPEKVEIKIMMSRETKELFEALLEVKKALRKGVKKKSENPYFTSSYADLNTHLDYVEPTLHENGLFLLQPTQATERANFVTTTIIHAETGQYVGATMKIPDLADAQKTLGGLTYFRRGGLNALLALKSVDDDGEGSVGRGDKKRNKFKKKKRSTEDEF